MSLPKRAQKTPSKNHPSGNVVLQNADAGETKLSPSTLMYEPLENIAQSFFLTLLMLTVSCIYSSAHY